MVNAKLFLSFIFCCFLCSNAMFAQKAKFKNLRSSCQKVRLPQNYVEPENRTYNLYKKGAYSENVEEHSQGIYGWTIDTESPRLEAVMSIYGFRIDPAKQNAEKKVKKDKDGKVTDRWTEYSYTGNAVGKGTLYIYGESNKFTYEKKNRGKKSKAEEKKEAEEKAKKEALESNPFLSADDIASAEDAGESDISEDSGLDDANLELVDRTNLDVSTKVNTKKYRSSSKAYGEYKSTQKPKLYDFRDAYPERAYKKAMNSLNYLYGYSPVKYRVWLKEMKSEKHPEYKMWNNACQAAVTLFKTFKYNKSIKDSQVKFDPIISYFNQQVEAIPDSDRKGKKMKKAAFNNLINIMYYLDRNAEIITICEKYKDSKVLGKTAARMMERSDRQAALMAFHKVDSCHFVEMSDVEDEDFETAEEAEEEDGDTK